jgi:hypothetical protein
VGNNPIGYSDPTGHMRIEGGTGGSAYTPKPHPIKKPKPEDNGGGGSKGEGKGNGNQCGQGGVFDCPQKPNACYGNTVCMDYPNIDLHPYDIINPLVVGRSLVYSDNGEIIGYRNVSMIPDYQNFTFHAKILGAFTIRQLIYEATTNLMAKNFEFLGKAAAATTLKSITNALLVYDLAKLGNQVVTFESLGVKIGPIIPQRMLSPIPNVADPRGYFGIP